MLDIWPGAGGAERHRWGCWRASQEASKEKGSMGRGYESAANSMGLDVDG